ncbi:HEAT repeat domain-containing protein [Eubacteriales bacterium OttesenSCG-928-A19]|nr:HEAT repeat domain-containing protein [Eubacteriales bacterium OttesenSCG-928-A19]
MKQINFDSAFQEHMTAWVSEHAAEYGNNYDRLEERMPEVYLQWLNTPASWLNGATPGTYFSQFDDGEKLLSWMVAYFRDQVPVPDQLLERITDLGESTEPGLLALLTDKGAPEDARLTAITLLAEMQSIKPMALYIGWIAARSDADERADMAAEALVSMGRAVVMPVLAAVDNASAAGRETLLDVLCNFPGEDAILALALAMFAERSNARALFGSFLGKLGDPRAIEPLRAALNDPDLGYLDYIELRNALEALGGDAPPERSFDGDPYYESLRRME